MYLIRRERGQLCQIHSVDESAMETRFHFLKRVAIALLAVPIPGAGAGTTDCLSDQSFSQCHIVNPV
jgi:hypothetical protein